MTDLQVKYWTLKEAERSNREQESLKWSTLSETERSNKAQESLKQEANKLEAESINNLKLLQQSQVALNQMNVSLSNAQMSKIHSEINKLQAEYDQLRANTRLTQAEIDFYFYKELNAVTKSIGDIIGPVTKAATGLIK